MRQSMRLQFKRAREKKESAEDALMRLKKKKIRLDIRVNPVQA